MKRKIVGLALLASLIISVTSGCIVREGYGYHHYRYRHHDRDDYHHDHDDYRHDRDDR